MRQIFMQLFCELIYSENLQDKKQLIVVFLRRVKTWKKQEIRRKLIPDRSVIWIWRTIDYRCKDISLQVSASWMTILNPDSLSRSETWVNPGIRSWKSTYLNELAVRKPLVVSISQRSEELRLHNLVHNMTILNPSLKAVSSNASPGWTDRFFRRDNRGLLKEVVKTCLVAPMSPLNSPTYFLSSHL